jgi:hypothetical protein
MRLARNDGEGAPEAVKPLAVESNLYEECYAAYLLYASILFSYNNRYGEGERERELSSARSGVIVYRRKREHYGWTFRYRRLIPG